MKRQIKQFPRQSHIETFKVAATRAAPIFPPQQNDEPDRQAKPGKLCRVDLNGKRVYVFAWDEGIPQIHGVIVSTEQTKLSRLLSFLLLYDNEQFIVEGAEVHSLWSIDSKPKSRIHLYLFLCVSIVLALGWLHLPVGASLAELLLSRYSLTIAVLLGLYGLICIGRYESRVHARLSMTSAVFSHWLKPTPKPFRDGAAYACLGFNCFPVVECVVEQCTLWVIPGEEIDGGRYNQEMRFRFEAKGKVFEGRTYLNGNNLPFILPKDSLRAVVEEVEGRNRVLAFANLTDGHVFVDHVDHRVSKITTFSAIPGILLMLVAVPMLLLFGLVLGPQLDDVSRPLMAANFVLLVMTIVCDWYSRAAQSQLARALGARRIEIDDRGISLQSAASRLGVS